MISKTLLVTDQGEMKGCALCPEGSVWHSEVEDGVRWIKNGRDSIYPAISTVEIEPSTPTKKCNLYCRADFVMESKFTDGACPTCYNRNK